jgi:hypothetical protein
MGSIYNTWYDADCDQPPPAPAGHVCELPLTVP